MPGRPLPDHPPELVGASEEKVELSGSDATWKFVVYHHPAYSSGPNRGDGTTTYPLPGTWFVDGSFPGEGCVVVHALPAHT